MDLERQRKTEAILRILAESDAPLGSGAIAAEMRHIGIEMKDRMVRYYLRETDRLGLTESLGRGGRRLTAQGVEELGHAGAVDKVGFASTRVDELGYRMSFDAARRCGTVVLNVSHFRAADLPRAQVLLNQVVAAGLGMGELIALGHGGERLGSLRIEPGQVAIGTVCSVTLNGALLAAGVPIYSRFGGLLEMRDGKPLRFTQIIQYDGTTIDPVQIFLKGKMTRVGQAVDSGNGIVGASLREVPAVAFSAAERVIAELRQLGLGCVLAVGRPGRPLLDVPISPGRVGLVVAAGLNAIANVEEAGIETENLAMATMFPYEELLHASKLKALTS